MDAHQHGHVCAGERPFGEHGFPAAGAFQQTDDFVRGRVCDKGRDALLRAQFLAVRHALEEPKFQRGAVVGRDAKGGVAVPRRGYRAVLDFGRDERRGPVEQGVHRFDETGHRAPVAVEIQRLRCRTSRRDVREHVRAPEPVDRLLGIAHHDEGTAPRGGGFRRGPGFGGAAAAVDALEDAGLNRIGVLVFVDQRAGKFAAHPVCEACPVRAVQGVFEFDQQVVVTEAAVVADATAHRGAHLGQDFPPRPVQPLVICRPQGV